MFSKPSYIVFDIRGEMAKKVQAIRKFLAPERANLHVEISLSGSSGLGFIESGQTVEFVTNKLNDVVMHLRSFYCRFKNIECFEGTGIFYFTFENNDPFLEAFELLKNSGIRFLPIQFEYEPHCTLTLPNKLDNNAAYKIESTLKKIQEISVPQEKFLINSIALYVEDDSNSFKTIYKKHF